MRIAVVGPTYPHRGGIAQYTTILVDRLRERHEVLFVSYRKQYPDLIYPGRTQMDSSDWRIETDNIPLVSTFGPFSWRRTYRRIRSFNPNAVILTWVSTVGALQFRAISSMVKRGTEALVVFLCHNVIQHERRRWDAFLTRFAFKYGDMFIVNSEGDRAAMQELVPGASVIHLFHPTYDVFNRGSISRREARELLDVDGRILLFFGFVREYKGLMYLIRAMPRILGIIPDAHLMIVGEFWDDRGPYEREIEKLGISEAVTIVDDFVPNEEVEMYFAAADLLVLPYVSATSSGIIQIGYAFGLPVITTDVGGLPEVVEEGKTGYLVSPRDPDSLAGAVIRYFEEGDAEAFSEGIERLRESFSWDGYVEAIWDSVERIKGTGEH